MLRELLDLTKLHFDKLLMTMLLIITYGFFLHTIHHGADAVTISWWENIIGQILAALLTMMVGSRLNQRKSDDDKKKDESPRMA